MIKINTIQILTFLKKFRSVFNKCEPESAVTKHKTGYTFNKFGLISFVISNYVVLFWYFFLRY
jgi:uncharacterized protein YigE (DUF2233 family)